MRPLRVGTTASFSFGPFVSTAGAAVTDLTLNASNIFISKNGATLVKLNSTGVALVHDKDGYYDLNLDVTDLNTLGPGLVEAKNATALHVWEPIIVMTIPAYKFLYGATGASHVDQVFEDLSSLLNQTSALIQDSTLIKVSLSSILGETTILIADTSALKVDSTAIKGMLTSISSRVEELQADTTVIKVSLSSILSETTILIADTSALKVDSTAIKTALTDLAADTTAMGVLLSSILSETTIIIADTSALKLDSTAIKSVLTSLSSRIQELQADTTSLKVSMSSALNQSSALIDDSTVIKAQLTSISTGVTRILEDTTILKTDSTLMKVSLSSLLNQTSALIDDSTLIKVSLSSLLGESTNIIGAISSIPSTVLGVINSQVIDSTITRLESERIILSGMAGETLGAGTSEIEFHAAGTSAPGVARITADLSTLGERTGIVLDGAAT